MVKISKLDSARRQLETAVHLYFEEGDPVSIHTLVGAAHELVMNLNQTRADSPRLMKERLADYVSPADARKFYAWLNTPRNFFKHARYDAEALLDFNPDMTEYLLLDACLGYRQLTGEAVRLFVTYQAWFVLKNGNRYSPKNRVRLVHQKLKRRYGDVDRRTFYRDTMSLLGEVGLGVHDDG